MSASNPLTADTAREIILRTMRAEWGSRVYGAYLLAVDDLLKEVSEAERSIYADAIGQLTNSTDLEERLLGLDASEHLSLPVEKTAVIDELRRSTGLEPDGVPCWLVTASVRYCAANGWREAVPELLRMIKQCRLQRRKWGERTKMRMDSNLDDYRRAVIALDYEEGVRQLVQRLEDIVRSGDPPSDVIFEYAAKHHGERVLDDVLRAVEKRPDLLRAAGTVIEKARKYAKANQPQLCAKATPPDARKAHA